VSLALVFEPSTRFTAVLNVPVVKALPCAGPDEHPARVQVGLKEAFVALTDVLHSRVALQVGRQTFDDAREWLCDAELDLDAVRVSWRWAALTLEGSVSRRALGRRELCHPEASEPLANYLLLGRYAVPPAHTLAAYGLLRDDRATARDHAVWGSQAATVSWERSPGDRLLYQLF
jgi:hypothetical protein